MEYLITFLLVVIILLVTRRKSKSFELHADTAMSMLDNDEDGCGYPVDEVLCRCKSFSLRSVDERRRWQYVGEETIIHSHYLCQPLRESLVGRDDLP